MQQKTAKVSLTINEKQMLDNHAKCIEHNLKQYVLQTCPP